MSETKILTCPDQACSSLIVPDHQQVKLENLVTFYKSDFDTGRRKLVLAGVRNTIKCIREYWILYFL